jgi:formyltetrahydrofolate synthetase
MEFVSSGSRLEVKVPVPSDIDISQSIVPARINVIAERAGILPDEFEPYGKYKGKVSMFIH